jgi:two-component system sensor kinase FixL
MHIGEDARMALIDRVQVQQVLVNLLRNAVEAMACSGSPQVTVSTRPAQEGMIEVEVRDSGPGMPAEVLERLFLPFTTTKVTGMGVGLSLCRTIIEQQHGEIWGGNAPEGGACFRFTLPAARRS